MKKKSFGCKQIVVQTFSAGKKLQKHKQMKRIISAVIIILLVQTTISVAQTLKYKSVFEIVEKGNDQVSYPLLLQYQKQDPDMPNTYFQLALIAEKWAKEYDPFTELKVVNFFVQNTRLYWGLAKSKIDDKEVRKNRKYYENANITAADKKLEYEDVKIFVDKKFEDISEYQENVKKILGHYTKTADFYNQCVQTFRQINARFPKLKDLYLNADDSVRIEIADLKSSFDSTLFYFQEFKVAIKNYPIKEYRQDYVLKEIKTYRLEGLTSSDFLQNEVPIWDYGQWVKEVNKNLNKDIKNLTKQTLDANNELTKSISSFLNNPDKFSKKSKPYQVPRKTINLLNKYDHDPLLAHYLKQRTSYNELLAMSQTNYCNPHEVEVMPTKRRLAYYQKLIDQKQKSDSLLNFFKNKIDQNGIYKYRHIFIDKYGSKQMVEQYCDKQLVANNKALEKSLANLLQIIQKPAFDQPAILTFRNTEISSEIKPFEPDSAQINVYNITTAIKNSNNEIYFGGYIRGNGNNATAFAAKTSDAKNIDWLKAYTFKTRSYNNTYKIDLFQGGAIFAVVSGLPADSSQTVVILDEKGNQISKNQLENNGSVQKMFYDDINDQLLVAQQDKTNNQNILQLFYPTENKIAWTNKLQANADVFDVVLSDKDFSVFLNYQSHQLNGTLKKAPAQTNILVVNINTIEGTTTSHTSFDANTQYIGINAEKIDSESIGIIGKQNNNPIFLIVTPNGKIKFSNL